MSQAGLRDDDKIREAIARAEFVKKGEFGVFGDSHERMLTQRRNRSFVSLWKSFIRKETRKYTVAHSCPARYYLKRYRTLKQRYEPA